MAEEAGQLNALASLVGQTHRNIETRARLAGHGGFGVQKRDGGAEAPVFNLTMILGDRTETITAMPAEVVPDFPQRGSGLG